MKNLILSVSAVIILLLCIGLLIKKDKPKEKTVVTPVVVQKPRLSTKEYDYYNKELNEHFSKTLFSRGFNGGVVIAKDGEIVYERYAGFADFRTKDSMSENTSMHLASTSKTITGMTVLHLAEEGRLSIDDTLGKYFPGFPYEKVTIKMLLSQRSGLPNYLNYLSALKVQDTCYSNADVLNSLYTLRPGLEAAPGRRFHYSNTNFVLLALIVEKVTGESFPAYVKHTIFDPLQMTHTFVKTGNDSLVATPSFEWNGRYWQPDPFDCTYGDKNIYSTPRDMLKWDQALYNDTFFKKSTLEEAYTPYSNETRSMHNYGLGWRMLNLRNGKKVIYHNGRWHGTNSVFARLTDEKATIIIIGNKYNRNIYESGRRAYDIFGKYLQDRGNDHEINDFNDEDDKPDADTTPLPVKSPEAVKTKR